MTAVWVLACALAITPQVFFWRSASPFLLAKVTYVSLVGAFACLGLALAWRRVPPRPGIPRALLAPALVIGYAAARAPWFATARADIAAPFVWGVFLLVAWPTAALVQARPGVSARLVRLLAILGGLTAVYAILQAVGVDLPLYRQAEGRTLSTTFAVGAGGPPFATLGNPNFLGEYLAAVLPPALAGLVYAARARWAMGGAAGLIAIALPLTSARGAWLGAVVGLGVTALLLPAWRDRKGRIPRLVLAVMAFSVIAAAVMERLTETSGPWDKLASTLRQARSPAEGRRLWWGATLLMVADHPLAGVGEGRFRDAYPAYQAAYLASLPKPEEAVVWPSPVEAPHNDYLQVAAELGIPGLALLLGVLGLIAVDGSRAARGAAGPDRALRAGALGGLTAVLVSAIFGYPLHTATGLFLAATLSALAVSADPGREPAATAAPRWQWGLLITITALGFWQAAHLLPVFAASTHLHRGSQALLRRDFPHAIEALERAHQVNPRDSQIDAALGRAYLAAGRPDLALPYLRAGLQGFDASPLRTVLGRAYLATGQVAAAEETLRVGVRSFPGYAPLHLSYAEVLAGAGRDAEASRELARALARDPNLAEAHYVLGTVRGRLGDPTGAAAALRRFLELAAPGDPRVPVASATLREMREGPRQVDNGEKPVK